jgi:hypothetical protein
VSWNAGGSHPMLPSMGRTLSKITKSIPVKSFFIQYIGNFLKMKNHCQIITKVASLLAAKKRTNYNMPNT